VRGRRNKWKRGCYDGKRPVYSETFFGELYRVRSELFFPEDGVGLVPKRGCLLTLAYYAFPRWYEFEERRWNDTGENRRTQRKTCPSDTFYTTSPTWIDPGANPGLRGERPATNDLSHGTAHPNFKKTYLAHERIYRKVDFWIFRKLDFLIASFSCHKKQIIEKVTVSQQYCNKDSRDSFAIDYFYFYEVLNNKDINEYLTEFNWIQNVRTLSFNTQSQFTTSFPPILTVRCSSFVCVDVSDCWAKRCFSALRRIVRT
jgi:hypothetical protein